MKTLICKGTDPPHTFEHAGGRGRPPAYCPEHKPEKPVSKSRASVPGVTGVTAESKEAAPNPFVLKAQKEANKKKTEPARKAKEEKAQERAKAETEALEQEYMVIDERIEKATTDYLHSFEIANKARWAPETEKEFNKSWNRCDHRQNTLLNLCARKRILEKMVEDLTNPERESVTNGNMLNPDNQDRMMDELEEATDLLAEDDVVISGGDADIVLGDYDDDLNEREQELVADGGLDVADQFANILEAFEE